MKKHSGLVIAVKLIFVLSLCLLLYSGFQILKAPAEARRALQDWEKKREKASIISLNEQETPLPAGMTVPPQAAKHSQTAYSEGEIIGEIYFPKLDKRIAILEGTQRPQLKKGAGHDIGSAPIGAAGNSVLAGHRDTVFRGIGDLKKDDLIEVETAEGTFIYSMSGSTIVDGDARGVIRQTSGAVLTLITCYPFAYAGPAPDRYLLSATLLRKEPVSLSPRP
ncbi:sortase [Paenibacillus sp. S150]|uniref:sortase n=1 Tax=Paenibacillus sp. S150 TaxID=2749826 RepID=UPI001C58C9EF|nr:sortase [Paenibacillus sp. S150]MBW4082095.1 class D sortase [Paenibacillus sp. S150]